MDTLFKTYGRLLADTDLSFTRYLYDKINWDNRLIVIKGAKGVGKTTMLLQHIKRNFQQMEKALYVSLDNLWFANHTLLELAEYHYTHGGTHLFLDEVHKYKGWQQEVKNIYDSYPHLHLVVTGSSMLKLEESLTADLSRRHRAYTMYYPFYREEGDGFFDRLQQVIDTVVTTEIPAVSHIEYDSVYKVRQLLAVLAEMKPYTLNISSLCTTLQSSRNNVLKLLDLMDKAALVRRLYATNGGMNMLTKPEKILFYNTNLMHCLTPQVDSGTMRETYLASQVGVDHQLYMPSKGDLVVDDKWLFEVGGKRKDFSQIKNMEDSFVVSDNMEIGHGNKIPLWLFGFLY